MKFVMIYHAGPAYDADLSVAEPGVLADHVKLMHNVMERGVMIMGGPFTDGAGGMSVLDLPSRADAMAIADADPAVSSGHFEVEVRAWDTSDRRT